MQEAIDWHAIEAAEALTRVESSTDGLTSAAAYQRLAEHGPNTIEEKQTALYGSDQRNPL